MTPAPSFLERFPPWVEEYLASREAKARKILKVLQRQIALDPAALAVGRRLQSGPDHKNTG